MENEMMTYDEKANTDKLEFYWREKVKVHIILKRKKHNGLNVWINVAILDRLGERLWKVQELSTTRILPPLSISEIKENGISIFTEAGE